MTGSSQLPILAEQKQIHPWPLRVQWHLGTPGL